MKSMRRYTEPLMLTLAAALILLSNPHDHMRGWLEFFGATEFWLDRAGLLGRLATLNAGIAIVLAIGGAARIWSGQTSLTGWLAGAAADAKIAIAEIFAGEVRPALRGGGGWPLFGLIVLIGIVLRIYFMRQPMRFDEALTYMKFVRFDFWDMFHYPFPNNHVLHTILVKISTMLFGNSPIAIRLPAFLFGVATLILFTCLCRMWNEGSTGIFGGVTLGIFPFVVLFSTMGRGYTMLMFLSLALIVFARRAAARPGPGIALIMALLAAAGLWTMPSMLFPLAGIGLWSWLLALKEGTRIKAWAAAFALPVVIITTLVTFYCYLPVVMVNHGTDTLLGNKNVVAQPWPEFIDGILPHVFEIRSNLRRDIYFGIQMLTLALIAIGYVRALRRRDFGLITLGPAMLAGGLAVFFWKHKIPFPRTWIYLIPVLLLYGDAGFTWLVRMLPRRAGVAAGLLVCAAGALYAGNLIRNNTIFRYPDTGAMLGTEEVVLKIISMMDYGDVVTANAPADWIVYYYMHLHGAKNFRREPSPKARREFFIVRKGRYELKDLTDRPARLILDLPKSQLHVIEQTTATQTLN